MYKIEQFIGEGEKIKREKQEDSRLVYQVIVAHVLQQHGAQRGVQMKISATLAQSGSGPAQRIKCILQDRGLWLSESLLAQPNTGRKHIGLSVVTSGLAQLKSN